MNCRETIISVWALGKLGVSYRHLAGGVASPFTKAVVATAASAAGSAAGDAARRESNVDEYGIRSVSFMYMYFSFVYSLIGGGVFVIYVFFPPPTTVRTVTLTLMLMTMKQSRISETCPAAVTARTTRVVPG